MLDYLVIVAVALSILGFAVWTIVLFALVFSWRFDQFVSQSQLTTAIWPLRVTCLCLAVAPDLHYLRDPSVKSDFYNHWDDIDFENKELVHNRMREFLQLSTTGRLTTEKVFSQTRWPSISPSWQPSKYDSPI